MAENWLILFRYICVYEILVYCVITSRQFAAFKMHECQIVSEDTVSGRWAISSTLEGLRVFSFFSCSFLSLLAAVCTSQTCRCCTGIIPDKIKLAFIVADVEHVIQCAATIHLNCNSIQMNYNDLIQFNSNKKWSIQLYLNFKYWIQFKWMKTIWFNWN